MAGGLLGTLTSAISRMAKRATDSIDRTARDLGRRGSPDSEQTDAANERDSVESAEDFDRTARGAAGDKVRKDLYRTTKLNRVWRAIIERANRWRKRLTRPRGPAKAAMVGAGAFGGLMALAAAIDFVIPKGPPPPPPDIAMKDSSIPVEIDIPPPLPDLSPQPIDIVDVEQEFRIIRERFDRAALFANLHRERFDLDTADLPPAVEYAAAARASVSVREGGSTQTETTTVGQFYTAMPEARDEIEEAVRHNRGSGIRADINVSSGFATIRIRN